MAGAAGHDILRGGAQGDELGGGRGDDHLIGLAGQDDLYGDAGSDTLEGGSGDDYLDGGGGGFDVAVYSGARGGYDVTWSWEFDGVLVTDVAGGGGVDLLRYVEFMLFQDGLFETPTPPKLVGTPGDDVLEGSHSHDRIAGLGGNDLLFGLAGRDDLAGGGGSDELVGFSGIDKLRGGFGVDVLDGGNGRDNLRGGRDDDLLTGGGGVDFFILARGDGHDLATDFEVGVDWLDLRGHADVGSTADLTLTDEAEGLRVAFGADSILLAGLDAAGFSMDDVLI